MNRHCPSPRLFVVAMVALTATVSSGCNTDDEPPSADPIWSQISAGEGTTCGLNRSDGTVFVRPPEPEECPQ